MKKTFLISLFLLFSIVALSQTRIINGLIIGRKSSTTVLKIDSVSTNGTDIKFYRGSSILNPAMSDTVAFSSIGIYKADSNYRKPGSYTSRYDFKTEPTLDNLIRIYKGNGLTIKNNFITPLAFTSGNSLTSDRMVLVMTYVPDSCTVNGFKYGLSAQGAFTASSTNACALYSISGTTFTKIAETTNSDAIWKVAANAYSTAAFVTPVTIAPGYYYMALLYSTSAPTTAPAVYCTTMLQAWFSDIGTNYLACYVTANQTSMPASITKASCTRLNTPFLLIMY